MKDKIKNPITIIKVGDKSYKPTQEDLKKWRLIFTGEMSEEDLFEMYPHMKSQPVETSTLDIDADPDYHRVLLVKIGDEFVPTRADLEAWRQIFEEAANDKDFKIFTGTNIEIEEVKFDKAGKVLVE